MILQLHFPSKTYQILCNIRASPDAGDVGYYRFNLNAGDHLKISLMTTRFDAPVPDLVVMSPGAAGNIGDLSLPVAVPLGYTVEVIKGQKPVTAEYEPFSPVAIFNAASYSKNITQPGTYYVAVISPADETHYSIAIGYLEEFCLQEWLLVPINPFGTHLWEGQSILAILAPFLAVIILGLILIARRERKNKLKKSLSFWLATIAGLCYLGGAAIVLVQMFRVLMVTGFSAGVIVTIIFAFIPIILGIWALRAARSPSPLTKKDRLSLGIIGVLGLVFWAGLIIGPVIAIIAALVPVRYSKQLP